MAKKWRCTVCGYIHEGPEAPDQCPMCKVGKEKFVEVEEKLFGDCFETHDQQEGMACFLSREKPKPKAVFTNN